MRARRSGAAAPAHRRPVPCRAAAVPSTSLPAQSAHCGRAASAAGHIPVAAIPLTRRSGYWNRCRCRTDRPRRGSLPPSKMPSPSDASVSGQRPATAPDAASARISCSVVWVAWITHQRESTPALSMQPFDRPLAERGDALLHFLRLLRGVDMDRPLGRRVANGAQRLWCHRAQRMRRDADARRRQIGNDGARALDEPEKPLRIVEEAALAIGRCRAAESAEGVERRQQGQADPASPRWPWRCAPPSRRDRRRAGRRCRDADSETRRPW